MNVKDIIDLIDANYPIWVLVVAIVVTLMLWAAKSAFTPWIRSLVEIKASRVLGANDVRRHKSTWESIADLERASSGSRDPVLAQSIVNAKQYYAKRVARESGGHYIPLQVEQLVVVAVFLFLPQLFVGLVLPLFPNDLLRVLLKCTIYILCLLALCLQLILLVTNSANFPEMRSKWKAIWVRREMKRILKGAADPSWSYVVGPLARKTVRMLVESSDRWCLVRAGSERKVLYVDLAGSVDASEIQNMDGNTRYFVYSDYGESSARKVQELIERGLHAYNIGAVFDEQVLWRRLAIELDLLEKSDLVPPRIGSGTRSANRRLPSLPNSGRS